MKPRRGSDSRVFVTRRYFAQVAVLSLAFPFLALAQGDVQLSQNCVVSVLNRNIPVAADGSWVLPNVPANFGPVRARATCVQNGATVTGQSDYFTLPPNGTTNLPHVQLGNSTPIPSSLTVSASPATLPPAGQTVQLTVTSTYPDGTTGDVTAGSSGTVYQVSNSALATVSADGLVTAVQSGTVLVQARNEGTQGLLSLRSAGAPTGTNPSDPLSYDLSTSLSSIEVKPSSFTLFENPLFPSASVSQQLQVVGHLNDGVTTLDLTSTIWGTSYSSSDLTICNLGGADGNVIAGNPGSCTIGVTIPGFSATATGTVGAFSPQLLSSVSIPGYANGVAVSGNYAYVAAGSGGLQVVDVSSRQTPTIAASLALPGNAEAVQVVGQLAYVSAGAGGGLQIVDITNPLAPVLVSGISTGDEAWKTVVAAGIAYVANGASGLRTIDVTNPAAPVTLGSLALPGVTKGLDVDVSRKLVVTVGSAGLSTVDVTGPSSPVLLGSLTLDESTVDARDVALKGSFAFVATIYASLTSVDVTNPASPLLGTSTDPTLGGRLRSLAIVGNLAFGADIYFGRGVPIVDVSTPPALTPLTILYLFPEVPADYVAGTGISVDATYVYLTASSDIDTEKGFTGDTHLYVGLYVPPQDPYGIPPTVSILAPASGSKAIGGATLPIIVSAVDDVAVSQVTVQVNGQPAFTANAPPYQFSYLVPSGAASLTIGAQATDFGGNVGTAQPVSVTVVPGTVAITSPVDGGTVLRGGPLPIEVLASDNLTVDVLVNGQTVVQGASSPVEYTLMGPFAASTLTVVARATDASGQVSTAQATVSVVPGQPTEAYGVVVASGNGPYGGATVICRGKSAVSGADGSFSIGGLDSSEGPLTCIATAIIGGVANAAFSSAVTPVPGGNTNVGTLTLSPTGSRGRDFWLVNPGYSMGSAEPYPGELFLVSDTPANYTVSNASAGFTATGTVTPGSPALVSIPGDLAAGIYGAMVGEDLGIHVTSDADIAVFVTGAADVSLGIPVTSLGTEYILLSYPASPSVLAVVASQDATHVTISNACNFYDTVTLNQGQTYNLQCDDVSGAHVVSDKPIGVVSSDPNGSPIPATSFNPGYPTEMMLPVGVAWGTEVYGPPTTLQPSYVYRIAAAVDGTAVTADLGGGTTQSIQLNHGEFQELDLPGTNFGGVHFTSNQPILVMHYGADLQGATSGNSSSFAMQLVPVSNFGPSFRFYAPPAPQPSYGEASVSINKALIVAPNGAVGSVQLNGSPVDASAFTPLPGGAYQYAEVPVPDGTNVVTSAVPVMVYSIGTDSSYDYWLGRTVYWNTYGVPTRF